MSVKFWSKGSIFPTILKDGIVRIFFTTDLYIDVPFMNIAKDFVINNRIPVSQISLLCESPDGDIAVGWFNGEVRIYNTNYGDFFRMVGITKFDINKVIEEHMDVIRVGSTKLHRINEGKLTIPDIYHTRYYILKNNLNYMIMDTSDGLPPIIIDVKKNKEMLDKVLIKGSGADPMFVRQNNTFVEPASGYQIVDPIVIPQPTNNPRLIRRGI